MPFATKVPLCAKPTPAPEDDFNIATNRVLLYMVRRSYAEFEPYQLYAMADFISQENIT